MNALYKSPYTIDPGHFQIETYLVGYVSDTDAEAGLDLEMWRIAPTTIRAGLTKSVDLQVAVSPHASVRLRDSATGGLYKASGFGDTVTGIKWNIWGNDAGSTAFALAPSLKWPTSQDDLGTDRPEPALALPLAIEIGWGWWLGISPEVSFARNLETTSGYHFEFASTTYLWHVIYKDLSGYVEFSSWLSEEDPDGWWGTFDLGLTYLVTKNLQLDCGVLFGLTDAAYDLNPFLGISVRF